MDKQEYSRIEERINLQSLYSFFCHGEDEIIPDFSNFEERELIARTRLTDQLRKHLGNNADEIMTEIELYCSVEKSIHFSLGMKSGAKLLSKLLGSSFESNL